MTILQVGKEKSFLRIWPCIWPRLMGPGGVPLVLGKTFATKLILEGMWRLNIVRNCSDTNATSADISQGLPTTSGSISLCTKGNNKKLLLPPPPLLLLLLLTWSRSTIQILSINNQSIMIHIKKLRLVADWHCNSLLQTFLRKQMPKKFKNFWHLWTYRVRSDIFDVNCAWKWRRTRATCDVTWSLSMPSLSPTIVPTAYEFSPIDIIWGIISGSVMAFHHHPRRRRRRRCPEQRKNRRIMPKNCIIFSTPDKSSCFFRFRSA